jgi:hypothetical protein
LHGPTVISAVAIDMPLADDWDELQKPQEVGNEEDNLQRERSSPTLGANTLDTTIISSSDSKSRARPMELARPEGEAPDGVHLHQPAEAVLTVQCARVAARDRMAAASCSCPRQRTRQNLARQTSSAFAVLPSLDRRFMGMRPSPADQRRLDTILQHAMAAQHPEGKPEPTGAHLGATWRQRTVLTLHEFPSFFARTLLLCVAPCAIGFATISVGVWHAHLMSRDLHDVSASYEDCEQLTAVRSTSSIVAQCLKATMTICYNVVASVVALCALISWRIVLAVAARTALFQAGWSVWRSALRTS